MESQKEEGVTNKGKKKELWFKNQAIPSNFRDK